ncbi:TPA: hypothetical protein ACS3AC_000948 [Klebsiella pneumoniae]|nr:hypothetical protein [Klebsiella pneumoniae]HDY4998464.1 hypothetical protein [Klebsiella pneumoniae]
MSDRIDFALSGQAIRMKNLEVSVSMRIQDKDQSGQASSTASAQQGIKAKELRVTGLIPYDDEEQLTLLYALAEAQDSAGNNARYRVNHDTARKIKFREATFSGEIAASKAADLLAWRVSFSLREYFSVAEKKAEMRAGGGTAAKVQTAQGTTSATDAPEQLSWFEKVLKKVDTAIGSYDGGET